MGIIIDGLLTKSQNCRSKCIVHVRMFCNELRESIVGDVYITMVQLTSRFDKTRTKNNKKYTVLYVRNGIFVRCEEKDVKKLHVKGRE